MVSFSRIKDGFVFKYNTDEVAVGIYEQGTFQLLLNDTVKHFDNAMVAYSFLRNHFSCELGGEYE